MAAIHKALDDGVYALLRAAASLQPYGIYNTNPPPFPRFEGAIEEDQPPYIIFQLVTAPTDSTFGTRGFLCSYDVKAVSASKWPEEATTVADLIDTVMEGGSITVSGFNHRWATRLETIYFQEGTAGITFTHSGGVFELMEEAS